MFVSNYFLDELIKTVADEGNLSNLVVTNVRLVDNVSTKTLVQDSFTGTLDFTLDSTTGRAKLSNDLTYSIDNATVGGWIARNADSEDLFGADFDVAEVFAGQGEYILRADDTYAQVALKV